MLKVDWAQSEAWKGEGMSLPSECYSGCVYQKEGDDSGHHYSNLYLFSGVKVETIIFQQQQSYIIY